jgi:hypothetical protein
MGLGRVGVGSGRMGLGELHWDWGEWGELELLGATWNGVVDWTVMDGVSWGGFGAGTNWDGARAMC